MLIEDAIFLLVSLGVIGFLGRAAFNVIRSSKKTARSRIEEAKERLETAKADLEAARLEKEAEKLYDTLYKEAIEDDDNEQHKGNHK
jgi:type II secretory pathway pseudopilin PulG